jgi:C-8 sterol isomerase
MIPMSLLDPDALGSVVSTVVAGAAEQSNEQLIAALVTGLRAVYGDHIVAQPRWIFSMVGGATGVMTVLHASLTEYLVLFGTPLGTEGYSGRYSADIHDWVLRGEMWGLRLDEPMQKRVTGAGEVRQLPKGITTAFRLTEDSWLLEYGRGNAIAQLRHGIGDAVFRAMDAQNILDTLREYGTLAAKELFRGHEE